MALGQKRTLMAVLVFQIILHTKHFLYFVISSLLPVTFHLSGPVFRTTGF